MERHEKINHGWVVYSKLWDAVVAIVPENERQSNLQQEIVDSMKDLGENRRTRILLSQKAVPIVLWWVVGVGAIITMALSYIFASRFPKVQGFMTTLVASALGLNVWLLCAYGHPYSGELKIQPAMFQLVKDSVMKASDDPSPFLHDSKVPAMEK